MIWFDMIWHNTVFSCLLVSSHASLTSMWLFFYTFFSYLQTHDDVEHMALMERCIGTFPHSLIDRSKRAQDFFHRYVHTCKRENICLSLVSLRGMYDDNLHDLISEDTCLCLVILYDMTGMTWCGMTRYQRTARNMLRLPSPLG